MMTFIPWLSKISIFIISKRLRESSSGYRSITSRPTPTPSSTHWVQRPSVGLVSSSVQFSGYFAFYPTKRPQIIQFLSHYEAEPGWGWGVGKGVPNLKDGGRTLSPKLTKGKSSARSTICFLKCLC